MVFEPGNLLEHIMKLGFVGTLATVLYQTEVSVIIFYNLFYVSDICLYSLPFSTSDVAGCSLNKLAKLSLSLALFPNGGSWLPHPNVFLPNVLVIFLLEMSLERL